MKKFEDKLGKPSLQIQGLRIWIHHRQFPDAMDYWDGNWLIATAHCRQDHSEAWIVSEAFLRIPEIQELTDQLGSLQSTHKKIEFRTLEPRLSLDFEAEFNNSFKMKVDFSRKLNKNNEYIFQVTKRDLQTITSEIKEILIEYPVRGRP
jgi:hypothetical protein